MQVAWRIDLHLSNLILAPDGAILGTIQGVDERAIVAVDQCGRVTWRHPCERLPGHLTGCAPGAVFSLYERNEPTVVGLVDWGGEERWRFEEDWGSQFQGIQSRDDVVILTGSTFANRGLRVWLDANTGEVRRRDELPPQESFNSARPAGRWWLAQIDSGAEGLERIDPRTGATTILTSVPHIPIGIGDDAVYVDTTGYESPSSVIAFEIESGRELWRRRGGTNMSFGIDGDRIAFVSEDHDGRRAVVCDRRTGAALWRSEPLEALREDNYFDCLVNEHAVIVFGAYTYHAVYGYGAPEPRMFREQVIASKSNCVLDGTRYVERARDGLTCWSLA